MDRSPVPIVLAGSVDESQTIATVNIDYFQAANEAITLLIKNATQELVL